MAGQGDLRWHSEVCIKLFSVAAVVPELADDDWLEDRLADFMWWNHGLSVLKIGHASLDYRVKDRPDVRRVIETVLSGLSNVFERCLEICEQHAHDVHEEMVIIADITQCSRRAAQI